ncbi:MAG: 5'/3'-nucleotidase SurE, partial [Leadbetterella sp.]|nr:5'/3'-nucleotidase SurE [Leadbetterella sp.]
LNALHSFADLAVVAPATEQSAVGLSITIRHPLRIEKIEWSGVQSPIWSVSGTPADCVKMALSVVLDRTPDLIVSGINRGSNAGRNVLYSGTVAGVVEGTLHDIPGIAFSMAEYFNPKYHHAENYIQPIVEYILNHPLPLGTILNVNFPHDMETNFKGLRFAKQGQEYWAESPEQREHPAEGSTYYWLGAKVASFEEDHQSDIACLKQGYATAVPIHVSDLTHHHHLEKYRDHFESIVNLCTSVDLSQLNK